MIAPLPITTAPTDGRKVLVYDHTAGGWHTARWHDFERREQGRILGHGGAWFVASGSLRLTNPAHWMPCPPPPCEASDDALSVGA